MTNEPRLNLPRIAHAVRHDANNALMVLHVNIDMLSRGATSDAAQRQAARAEEATARLEALLHALLATLGRTPGVIEALAPQRVVEDALPLLRAVLGARNPVVVEGAPPASASIDRAGLEAWLLATACDADQQNAMLRLVFEGQALYAIIPDNETKIFLLTP